MRNEYKISFLKSGEIDYLGSLSADNIKTFLK